MGAVGGGGAPAEDGSEAHVKVGGIPDEEKPLWLGVMARGVVVRGVGDKDGCAAGKRAAGVLMNRVDHAGHIVAVASRITSLW